MNIFAYAFVSVCWAVAPLIKRRTLDYMSIAAVGDSESPVPTFVALFSALSSILLCIVAAFTPFREYIRVIPAEGWSLLIVGAFIGAAASVVLVGLLKDGNPGLTMLYLNATTSILSYVWGALIYGKLTLDGVAGAILVAAGVSLTSQQ